MIDKISNTIVNDKVKSVYGFNDYSIQDLLSKFFEQINSVTDLVNQNEEKINTQNFKLEEFINYMKNEGIPPIVIETVTTMYNDGRLTELFNNLANNVIDKVEDFKTQVNSSLEQKATKKEVEVERNRIDLLIKIESGETEGNAELLDIRNGADGVTYETAGNSVRTQFQNTNKKIDDLTIKSTNLFNPNTAQDGYVLYSNNGNVYEASNYFTSSYIDVHKKDISIYFSECRYVATYDKDKVYINTIAVENKEFWRKITSDSTIRYIRFSALLTKKYDIFVAYSSENVVPTKESYYIKLNDSIKVTKESINMLRGKTIYCLGDSIMAGTIARGGFPTLLKEMYGMNVVNRGVNGATLTLINGQLKDSVINHVTSIIKNMAQPDFIIINGGSNDYDENRAVGTIADMFNYELPSDYATYSDALEWIFYTLKTKWVGTKIIYLTTHKQQRGDLLNKYFEQGKKVCDKWCVDVVDLYNRGNLNTKLEQYRIYTDEGGTHPNELGYRKFFIPKIAACLESNLDI